jgi:hypothetical protein
MKETLIGITAFLALLCKSYFDIDIPQEAWDNLTEGILLLVGSFAAFSVAFKARKK